MSKKFTFYWLDGSRNVLSGDTVEGAFTAAGYGGGAIKAVDFYENGEKDDYQWDKEAKKWIRKVPINIEQEIAKQKEKKFKLFVSYNLGASYTCEYSTDDKNDLELKRLIHIAQQNSHRYYVEGDDSVICQQHLDIINFLGDPHQQRTIKEQAELLRNKFKPQ